MKYEWRQCEKGSLWGQAKPELVEVKVNSIVIEEGLNPPMKRFSPSGGCLPYLLAYHKNVLNP